MDPVDFGFTVVLLGFGSLLVGLGVWTWLRPPRTADGRSSTAHHARMSAGMLLIGVGILVRAPASALAGPHVLADLVSLLALAFSLAGASLAVWGAVGAREAGRSA